MWGQVLVALILIAIIALCIRSLVKDHRSGKSVLCGEDCSVCGPGGCPFEDQFKEIYDEYLKELDAREQEKLNQFEMPAEVTSNMTVDVTADVNDMNASTSSMN